ncbi:MAG: protease inhibitor I42 family protein [Bacillota bacterium]
MGRWIRAVLLTIVVVCVAWAIVAAKSAPPKPTAPGASIEVKLNGVFTVVLESNPSTGYAWVPKTEGQPFELVSEEYRAGLDAIGAAGVQVFKVKALQAGSFKLRFDYARSWEEQSANQAEFTIVVK